MSDGELLSLFERAEDYRLQGDSFMVNFYKVKFKGLLHFGKISMEQIERVKRTMEARTVEAVN